jgi:hypothetical protein
MNARLACAEKVDGRRVAARCEDPSDESVVGRMLESLQARVVVEILVQRISATPLLKRSPSRFESLFARRHED